MLTGRMKAPSLSWRRELREVMADGIAEEAAEARQKARCPCTRFRFRLQPLGLRRYPAKNESANTNSFVVGQLARPQTLLVRTPNRIALRRFFTHRLIGSSMSLRNS